MWEVYSDTVGIVGYVQGRNRTAAIRAVRRTWPWLDDFKIERTGE